MILRITRSGSTGMTLVELMVGMAVGLFVATVAISTFVSTRTLNVVNASTTRMSENARLAMELLHTDLRGSGFAGCRPLATRLDEPVVSVLSGGIDTGFITEGSSALRAYKGTGSAFSPALSAKLAQLGTSALPGSTAPVRDSDILSVRVPVDTVALGVIGTMGSATASPQLKPGAPDNPIKSGDVVLISNCKAATIFQVTANPLATGILSHEAGGGFVPGNTSLDLRHAYRSDATVYPLQTRHYYVAPRPRLVDDGSRSLWRLTVPGDGKPIEVARGIDKLTLSFGVDAGTQAVKNVNRYFEPSDTLPWDRVLSARVEMVAATPSDGMARLPQVEFAATDRRVRTRLSEVVTLRNNAP